MYCFSCNTEIPIKERVFFRDRCPKCDAPQHVCRNCDFYDKAAYNQCRETKAERQVEKERENRCEYFRHSDKAHQKPDSSGEKNKFDDLFK